MDLLTRKDVDCSGHYLYVVADGPSRILSLCEVEVPRLDAAEMGSGAVTLQV